MRILIVSKMAFNHSRFLMRKGYFVDASVILSSQANKKGALFSFINNSRYRFICTETTRNELEGDDFLYSLPRPFLFLSSDLDDNRKQMALDYFTKKHKRMAPEKLDKLKNKLLVMMEAEHTRHDIGTIDATELLTIDTEPYETDRTIEKAFRLAELKNGIEIRSAIKIAEKWNGKRLRK